jgi:hypothetical protein
MVDTICGPPAEHRTANALLFACHEILFGEPTCTCVMVFTYGLYRLILARDLPASKPSLPIRELKSEGSRFNDGLAFRKRQDPLSGYGNPWGCGVSDRRLKHSRFLQGSLHDRVKIADYWMADLFGAL